MVSEHALMSSTTKTRLLHAAIRLAVGLTVGSLALSFRAIWRRVSYSQQYSSRVDHLEQKHRAVWTRVSYSSFSNTQLLRASLAALFSPHVRAMMITALGLTWFAQKLKLPFAPRTFLMSFFGTLWIIFYQFNVVESPAIQLVPTQFNHRLVEHAKLYRPYYPVFWMANTHAMTVLTSALSELWFAFDPRHRVAKNVRIRVPTFDGETVALDWSVSPWNRGKGRSLTSARSCEDGTAEVGDRCPIVVGLHGLGADSTAPYIKQLMACCQLRGWRCVSIDYWRSVHFYHGSKS